MICCRWNSAGGKDDGGGGGDQGETGVKRPTLSAKERTRLFLLHGGVCHLCTRRIAPGEEWQVEHPQARALGGADVDDNMKPAHVDCHKPKTARDVAMMAKINRVRAKHLGVKTRRSRPVPGSRNSPFKKHLDGTVTRRDR